MRGAGGITRPKPWWWPQVNLRLPRINSGSCANVIGAGRSAIPVNGVRVSVCGDAVPSNPRSRLRMPSNLMFFLIFVSSFLSYFIFNSLLLFLFFFPFFLFSFFFSFLDTKYNPLAPPLSR